MSSIVTMVSAHVPADRAAELSARFTAAVRAGLPERRHTSLLRGDHGVWCIMTFWESRHRLEAYLASTEEPFARRLLREVGGVPEVETFELVADSDPAWWS
jgi:heme-degrading monooxygenase HmoA